MKSLIFTSLVLLIAGCSSGMKAVDCEKTDWYQKGLAEGSEGENIKTLYKYTKQCDDVGSSFSADEYRKGREEGLLNFCTEEKAFNLGLENKSYDKSVCSKSKFPLFSKSYKKGKLTRKLKKSKEKIEKEINSLEEEHK